RLASDFIIKHQKGDKNMSIIGGGIGIGVELPGIGGGGIGIGGGINIGIGGTGDNSGSGGSGASPWVQIFDLDSPIVPEVARFSVERFNLDHNNTLRYQHVYEGWVQFVDENTKRYRLKLTVLDCLERLLRFEVIVCEVTNGDDKYKLESFVQIH
uniref:hypothetical protein n=1 Tax=Escherichia coli TaxID=562 RepID=UPI0020BDCC1B